MSTNWLLLLLIGFGINYIESAQISCTSTNSDTCFISVTAKYELSFGDIICDNAYPKCVITCGGLDSSCGGYVDINIVCPLNGVYCQLNCNTKDACKFATIESKNVLYVELNFNGEAAVGVLNKIYAPSDGGSLYIYTGHDKGQFSESTIYATSTTMNIYIHCSQIEACKTNTIHADDILGNFTYICDIIQCGYNVFNLAQIGGDVNIDCSNGNCANMQLSIADSNSQLNLYCNGPNSVCGNSYIYCGHNNQCNVWCLSCLNMYVYSYYGVLDVNWHCSDNSIESCLNSILYCGKNQNSQNDYQSALIWTGSVWTYSSSQRQCVDITPFPTTSTTTDNPTPSPTDNPTPSPTDNPTPSPTDNPTPSPTDNPTPSPTDNPTPSPTDNPTPSPTDNPTPSPTDNPTPSPTDNPTPSPTDNPTPSPTANPSASTVFTAAPTSDTVSPTKVTLGPTANTAAPTAVTFGPTSVTVSPSADTESPTSITIPPSSVTAQPTHSPVTPGNPTGIPTDITVSPSNNPTSSHTDNPTPSPTNDPTPSPTDNPTPSPTDVPIASGAKTNNPTRGPTDGAAVSLTKNPTLKTYPVTTQPTKSPTNRGENKAGEGETDQEISTTIILNKSTEDDKSGNDTFNDSTSIKRIIVILLLSVIVIMFCVLIRWRCLKKRKQRNFKIIQDAVGHKMNKNDGFRIQSQSVVSVARNSGINDINDGMGRAQYTIPIGPTNYTPMANHKGASYSNDGMVELEMEGGLTAKHTGRGLLRENTQSTDTTDNAGEGNEKTNTIQVNDNDANSDDENDNNNYMGNRKVTAGNDYNNGQQAVPYHINGNRKVTAGNNYNNGQQAVPYHINGNRKVTAGNDINNDANSDDDDDDNNYMGNRKVTAGNDYNNGLQAVPNHMYGNRKVTAGSDNIHDNQQDANSNAGSDNEMDVIAEPMGVTKGNSSNTM